MSVWSGPGTPRPRPAASPSGAPAAGAQGSADALPGAVPEPSEGSGNRTSALVIGVAVLALVGAAVAGGMALAHRRS